MCAQEVSICWEKEKKKKERMASFLLISHFFSTGVFKIEAYFFYNKIPGYYINRWMSFGRCMHLCPLPAFQTAKGEISFFSQTRNQVFGYLTDTTKLFGGSHSLMMNLLFSVWLLHYNDSRSSNSFLCCSQLKKTSLPPPQEIGDLLST